MLPSENKRRQWFSMHNLAGNQTQKLLVREFRSPIEFHLVGVEQVGEQIMSLLLLFRAPALVDHLPDVHLAISDNTWSEQAQRNAPETVIVDVLQARWSQYAPCSCAP